MSVCNHTCRKYLTLFALSGILGGTAPVYGDATLVYQTVDADGEKMQHTFSISGRFVRVESDTAPDRFQVIDTGMLTMADVDRMTMRYTFENLPRGYPSTAVPATRRQAIETPEETQSGGKVSEPVVTAPVLSPTPQLSPTRKKQNMSGIVCRMVREMVDGRPVAEHCMAGTGPMGVSSREMITLSRLFTLARRMELGWAGVATADERIASVDSQLADRRGSQTLLSISYDWIPDAHMQVSKKYKRVKSLSARPEAAVGEQRASSGKPQADAEP